MSHGHGHGGPIQIGPTASRVVIGLLVVIGMVVVAAAVALWPDKNTIPVPLPFQNADAARWKPRRAPSRCRISVTAEVLRRKVFVGAPQPPPTSAYQCQRSIVDIESGPNAGTKTLLEVIPGAGQPDLRVGDHIRLVRQTDPNGNTQYSFEDYSRGLPLALIVIAFAVVIIAVARWRGCAHSSAW